MKTRIRYTEEPVYEVPNINREFSRTPWNLYDVPDELLERFEKAEAEFHEASRLLKEYIDTSERRSRL